MKGRIYKNRLSSTSNDLQPYIGQNPILYTQLYQQQQLPSNPSSFNMNYQNTGLVDRFMRSVNNNYEESEIFYKSPNGTIINKLYEREKPSYGSVQSRSGIHKPSINQHMPQLTDKLTRLQSSQANSRFLKRIVSNPDLHYSAHNIPQQINQQPIDHQQQQLMQDHLFLNNSSSHNRSTLLSPNRMRMGTPLKKGSGYGGNVDSSGMVNNKRAFAYQLENNNNNFSSGLGVNTQMRTQMGQKSFHSSTTPIPQSSPFIIPTHNDNSRILTTDYISTYEKRHKQRIVALQSQHQMELQFYQEEIKSKDELIEEMSRSLREKEEIIKKLQNQNANLTSRSYPSFANNTCRE